jgi:hypothetical protein
MNSRKRIMLPKGFKHTKETFIEKARSVHGDKYDYSLVEYKTNKINVKIVCPRHGVFEQAPNHHFKRYGCRKCTRSKGEALIEAFLESKGLAYKNEFSFPDCVHKKPLVFDFKIELSGEIYLIEFQGKQHFEHCWNDKERCDLKQKRDQIKLDYCQANRIPLLCIPYTKIKQIEKLITEFLKI